jgi:hypothetical protein
MALKVPIRHAISPSRTLMACSRSIAGVCVPLEEISRLVGQSSTAVTELVYRKQIRPVIQAGAVVMDRIFPE